MPCRIRWALVAGLFVPMMSLAADWPHWLGPNRNGSSPEKGLLTTWPKTGPKSLWKVPGGEGYSTVAVAGNKAYTLVQRGKEEQVICLDIKEGKELWKKSIALAYKNQYGNGPRSTPSIDGDRVYAQSVSGPLACLEADSGKIVWQHDLLKEFKAKNISWGLSASPTVDGDLVFGIAGAEGASVVAFNKKDGTLVWKSGDDAASYASPMPVTVGGQRQIICFTATALRALSAKDGKELWSIPWVIEYQVNICTPLLVGMDRLFVSTGEAEDGADEKKGGCVMYQLKADGPPAVLWQSRGTKSVMLNYWANSVLYEGHLYGMSGEFSKKIHLNCVDASTGKLIWSQKDFGKASVTLADGHLILVTKKGDLVLAAASSKGYEEKARVTLLGDNRTAATLANGRLFLRDKQNIHCLDIAGSK